MSDTKNKRSIQDYTDDDYSRSFDEYRRKYLGNSLDDDYDPAPMIYTPPSPWPTISIPSGLGFDWGMISPSKLNTSDNKSSIKAAPKCTCGMSITMGKEDQASFHSDWCDVKGTKK